MKRFSVKFQRTNSSIVVTETVAASSASQAREQIKAKCNGKVTIISVVEK
jgi:hypothetical protein